MPRLPWFTRTPSFGPCSSTAIVGEPSTERHSNQVLPEVNELDPEDADSSGEDQEQTKKARKANCRFSASGRLLRLIRLLQPGRLGRLKLREPLDRGRSRSTTISLTRKRRGITSCSPSPRSGRRTPQRTSRRRRPTSSPARNLAPPDPLEEASSIPLSAESSRSAATLAATATATITTTSTTAACPEATGTTSAATTAATTTATMTATMAATRAAAVASSPTTMSITSSREPRTEDFTLETVDAAPVATAVAARTTAAAPTAMTKAPVIPMPTATATSRKHTESVAVAASATATDALSSLTPKHVRWEAEDASTGDTRSPLIRHQRASKTLNMWLSAMVESHADDGSPIELPLVSRHHSASSPTAAIPAGRSARSLRSFTKVVAGLSDPSSPQSGRSTPHRRSPWTSPSTSRSLAGSVNAIIDGASPHSLKPVSVLATLRNYFLNSIDADGSGHLSKKELFDHIKALTEETSGPLDEQLLELLGEVVRVRFGEIDLGLKKGRCLRECLGVDEWVHFMLLQGSAPSHIAAKHLNQRLSKALAEDPGLLGRLHAAFEVADIEGDGLLRQEKLSEAFWAVSKSHPPEEVLLDREEDGSPWALSYYEFVGHVLGLTASVVELALYDLSHGGARWVPPSLLGGHKFDGIWHSGVRVFDKEFWFGGAILESNFSDIPFGTPTKILRLGTTLRTAEELVEFLKEDIYVDYNPKSYDVLRRNCNHFSNELVQFLLHGKQLPEEILLQPQWAQSAALVNAIRPFLNRWLGGFGDEDATDSPSGNGSPPGNSTPRVVSRVDDMTEEWRNRLKAGDIVMYRKSFIERAKAVGVHRIAVDGGGRRTAEIIWFRPTAVRWEEVSSAGNPWTWEVAVQPGVPLRQLFPLLGEVDGGAHILKASLVRKDRNANSVLKRNRDVLVKPLCPKGHRLKVEEPPSWWSQPASPCSICSKGLDQDDQNLQRLGCNRCNFVVCASCMDRGLNLDGGGAFVDVLSRPLAEALLNDKGWLSYKARSYFFKADHNGTGFVDRAKIRRVDARLAAELEVKHQSDAELAKMMVNAVFSAKEVPAELDETKFEAVFIGTLRRALDLLKMGKTWPPRADLGQVKVSNSFVSQQSAIDSNAVIADESIQTMPRIPNSRKCTLQLPKFSAVSYLS